MLFALSGLFGYSNALAYAANLGPQVSVLALGLLSSGMATVICFVTSRHLALESDGRTEVALALRGEGEGQAIEAMASEDVSLDRLRDLIFDFDVATTVCEHETLEIDIQKSLYRYDEPQSTWSGRTVEIRMAYDGKILEFKIKIGSESSVPEALAVVMTDSIPRRYFLSETPILSPVDAKRFIAFLMTYFRAFVFKMRTK